MVSQKSAVSVAGVPVTTIRTAATTHSQADAAPPRARRRATSAVCIASSAAQPTILRFVRVQHPRHAEPSFLGGDISDVSRPDFTWTSEWLRAFRQVPGCERDGDADRRSFVDGSAAPTALPDARAAPPGSGRTARVSGAMSPSVGNTRR